MNHPRHERLQLMLSPEELSAIDEFRFDHRISTRAAAVRLLLKIGLDASPRRATSIKTSSRAAELAAEVIDARSDQAATSEERATRKQRLLKGPSAFRKARKDRDQ